MTKQKIRLHDVNGLNRKISRSGSTLSIGSLGKNRYFAKNLSHRTP